MTNIIGEDCCLNPELTEFPSSNINVAIFGTQSSGKSTLVNTVFSTKFPVLNTKLTRQRTTKGVWFSNINQVNIIDTEGFDSVERAPEEKIMEKQVALFCLALSDVLIINMWMNEVGRYEGSHSHILKSIIKASERLISSQQRRIIFVVKDCTVDADRDILKEELSSHVLSIIKGETNKSTLKFTVEYFFMSHFVYKKNEYQKEAKELAKVISNTKKSNLSNYTPTDRLFYIKELWEKITSAEAEVDLRSIEDALKSYTLQKLKAQTIQQVESLLSETTTLHHFHNFQQYNQYFNTYPSQYFNANRPRHIREKDIGQYLVNIGYMLQNKIYFNFVNVMLQHEEDALIERMESKLDENIDSLKLESILKKERAALIEEYRLVIKGMPQSEIYQKKFATLIQEKLLKYHNRIEHLVSLFETQLEKKLNQELDDQTLNLEFNPIIIRTTIEDSIHQHLDPEYVFNNKIDIDSIWQNVVERGFQNNLIKVIPEKYHQNFQLQPSFKLGSSMQTIEAFCKTLEEQAIAFCKDIVNFHYQSSQDQTEPVPQAMVDQIKEKVSELLSQAIIEERKKFHISLLVVVVLMMLCSGEIAWVFRLFMKKKRVKVWLWIYRATLAGLVGVLLYRKKQYLRSYFNETLSQVKEKTEFNGMKEN